LAFISNNHSLVAKLKALFPDEDIDAALSGIELCNSETDILKKIAEDTVNYGADLSSKRDYLKKHYDLTAWIYPLIRIEKSKASLTTEDERREKDAEKIRLTRDFLPAIGFVDISEFFHAEEGTVKFLGADVHYQGEQVLTGENTVNALDELRYLCDDHGYSAIVFDSGAGTQSSADAFHRFSDLIIYCMRPTKQFRQGTVSHLVNYQKTLEEIKASRELGEDKKLIILLPTAVPNNANTAHKAESAFRDIRTSIINIFPQLIDASFCSIDTALNEVESFKWEERILTEETIKENPDEIKAYGVYKALAKKIVEITE
jgi:hypothetical protein